MSKKAHFIYISLFIVITVFVSAYLFVKGFSFYNLRIEDRFFHPDYVTLKPSGSWGHGFGIIGSLLMLIGVSTYLLRKRIRRFGRIGILKHWLEFHIFTCTLGPILVLYHTSFKLGGIVAVSFWSMVAVVVSGVIGRFIYIQIPRTIEGRELSLSEVKNLKIDLREKLNTIHALNEESFKAIIDSTKPEIGRYHSNILSASLYVYKENKKTISHIKQLLQSNGLTKKDSKQIIQLIKNELSLNRKIERLQTMQNLLKYWHVAHLPFALVMLIIMIIHVAITLLFGYKWIF